MAPSNVVGRVAALAERRLILTNDDSSNPQPGPIAADYDHLCSVIRAYESVLVAFSAGVDSTLVVRAAIDALGRANVLAVTARSASVPAAELKQAVALAESIGAEHAFVDTDEFDNPNYTSNPTNRCYYCKSTLYGHLAPLAKRRGIGVIANGANTDDLGDWRPGLIAAEEFDVRAPLIEAGLNKSQVRQLSRQLGLPTHDKPASPCLSSRIPYGAEVTPQKLRMVEAAESFLKDQLGLRELRVRHYGDEARIEAPNPAVTFADPETIATVDAHLRSLGFGRVTIDPAGFRSGSLNEVIAFGSRQINSQ